MAPRRPSSATAELASEQDAVHHVSRRSRVANAIGNLSATIVLGTFIGSMIDYWPDEELDFRLVYFATAGVAGLGALVAGSLGAERASETLEVTGSQRQQDET